MSCHINCCLDSNWAPLHQQHLIVYNLHQKKVYTCIKNKWSTVRGIRGKVRGATRGGQSLSIFFPGEQFRNKLFTPKSMENSLDVNPSHLLLFIERLGTSFDWYVLGSSLGFSWRVASNFFSITSASQITNGLYIQLSLSFLAQDPSIRFAPTEEKEMQGEYSTLLFLFM